MADNKHCAGCFYYRDMYAGYKEYGKCCHYLLMTDKKRPCEPGEGCTVKVNKRKGKTNGKG